MAKGQMRSNREKKKPKQDKNKKKGNAQFPFPSLVQGGGGIGVSKSGSRRSISVMKAGFASSASEVARVSMAPAEKKT